MGYSRSRETIILRTRDKMIEKITHLFNNAQSEILFYASAETLKVTTDNETLRRLKTQARQRGVKLRYLTEITPENINFCREQMRLVDELRHLDGMKGNFMLSESEFMVSPEISEQVPMTCGSHGSHAHLLRLYWGIFETAWQHGTFGSQRIIELEAQRSKDPSRQESQAKPVIRMYICAHCSMIF
jgi:hypothetical protein